MLKYILPLFFIYSVNTFSQTQHEMHVTASEEYKKADTELNQVYKQILSIYSSDYKFIKQLKITQRIWIQYRDAELEMKFPGENKQFEYGSIYPICMNLYLKELTEERTRKLKIWLNGIEEGESCTGSIKNLN